MVHNSIIPQFPTAHFCQRYPFPKSLSSGTGLTIAFRLLIRLFRAAKLQQNSETLFKISATKRYLLEKSCKFVPYFAGVMLVNQRNLLKTNA